MHQWGVLTINSWCLGQLLQLHCLDWNCMCFLCQCLPQIAHDRRIGSISFVAMHWLVRASCDSHGCWNQWLCQNPPQPHHHDASVVMVMVSSWSLAASVDSIDVPFHASGTTSTMLGQSGLSGLVALVFVDRVLSCWTRSFVLGRTYLAWLQYWHVGGGLAIS